MGKHDNTHYFEKSRMFWPVEYTETYNEKTKKNEYVIDEHDKYKRYYELSVFAKHLYDTLKELEARYTGINNDAYTLIFEGVKNSKNWFYCGMEKLVFMSGLSESTVRRARKELLDAGLIDTGKCWFTKNGKRTSQWVTSYRVYGETELLLKKLEERSSDRKDR